MWTDAKFVNIYVNSKEGDMEGEDGPGKLDRIATVEVPQGKKEGNHGHGSTT